MQGRGFYHAFVDTVKYSKATLDYEEGSMVVSFAENKK